MKSHVKHTGRRVNSNSQELVGEQGLIEFARVMLKGLQMRKYKWYYMYRQQKEIGFKRSFSLRMKNHLKVMDY